MKQRDLWILWQSWNAECKHVRRVKVNLQLIIDYAAHPATLHKSLCLISSICSYRLTARRPSLNPSIPIHLTSSHLNRYD